MQAAHNARPKHGPHLSISDDTHHVTDAISSLYDYAEQAGSSGGARPLSFMPSAREEIQLGRNIQPRSPTSPLNPSPFNPASERLAPDSRNVGSQRQTNGVVSLPGRAGPGPLESGSPLSTPSPADTAQAPFPINNIDYESSPAAVAQELSNLQALRRMSMNVETAGDPDLPSFGGPSSPDAIPDASSLFWVPARLHPELAPKEFKSFLDSKVESIKRRSGDFSQADEGLGRSPSAGSGGLQRSKSKLSRQIDNTGGRGAEGYEDSADRLGRQRSNSRLSISTTPANNLSELEALMEDPEGAIGRLSLESRQKAQEGEDMQILPSAPPGTGSLKRSTRTQYRKGSLRRGERMLGSRRGQRPPEQEEPPPLPTDSSGLHRSNTDPTAKSTSNFSRPSRAQSPPSSAGPTAVVSFDSILTSGGHGRSESLPVQSIGSIGSEDPRYASAVQGSQPLPHIVETPPSTDQQLGSHRNNAYAEQGSPRANWRQGSGRQEEPAYSTIEENPGAFPGSNTRTENLSYVPTIPEEKRVEPKKSISKKRSNDGSKKSGWSWGSILGSDDKKEEKERKRREAAEKAAEKAAAAVDEEIIAERRKNKGKNSDNTRLDLLQQTMDSGTRGRESLVLDRNEIELEEARKGESNRRSGNERKHKEKDGGLLQTLFGGKKKTERESTGKSARHSLRPASPEPVRPALVPDVDYSWTRFSILEERAIYRMAHLKLANPRRELRSQVLLSNFMYSYLAKVQQMHPQIQIPQSAAQKAAQRQQREQQRKEQPEEYYQYQRYQEQLQAQDATSSGHDGTGYDEHGYDDYDQGGYDNSGHDAYGQGGNYGYHHQGYSHEQSPYQYQQGQFDDPGRRDDDDDMW